MVDASRKSIWSARVVAAYLILGAALLSNRLFAVLHAESSAVVAFAAFFIAGLHVLSYQRAAPLTPRLLGAHLALLTIPLVFLTASQLVYPNCAYWTGLYLFAVFTIPSVVFGTAVATAIHAYFSRFRKTAFICAGFLVTLAGVIFDLGFHPQFFTLNHVFGGVLGPVYEQALYLRPGLLVFRAQTLLWSLLLVASASATANAVPGILSRTGIRRVVAGTSAVLIGLIYLFGSPLGINTTHGSIIERLPGHLQTEHFDVYYLPKAMDEDEVQALALEHEYRHAWLRDRLGVEPKERIRSYVYPTVELKLRLTGAGLTDVSPVWLPEPQMHILKSSFGQTFGHELVHVFSREFGLPVINASFLVGMVEGVAVAFEPPDGRPPAREQISVATMRASTADVGLNPSPARDVVRMMSPSKFWSSRGAVSYTTAGSFVNYLASEYGVDRLRRVYARGDFDNVYDRSLESLAVEWEEYLAATPVVSIAADDIVMRRFTIPSLFEMDCPHYLPDYAASYRRANDRLAVRDTVGAIAALEASLETRPEYVSALTVWAGLMLKQGQPELILDRTEPLADSLFHPALHAYVGDALALNGDSTEALVHYEAALSGLPRYARDARMAVLIRKLGRGSGGVARAFHGLTADASLVHDDARAAYYLAESYRYGLDRRWWEALDTISRMDTGQLNHLNPAESEFLLRMVDAWSGLFSLRNDDAAAAIAHLERARTAAQRVGDFAHASEMADMIDKSRWASSRL